MHAYYFLSDYKEHQRMVWCISTKSPQATCCCELTTQYVVVEAVARNTHKGNEKLGWEAC